jgi:hypothetical protein
MTKSSTTVFWLALITGWCLFFAWSCGRQIHAAESPDMTCQHVAYGAAANGQRCENTEAVCYLTDDGAMSCLPKGK